MRCKKCGSEIPEGCLYCSRCGHEVQFVTGDEILEDEYLNALLKNGAKEEKNAPDQETVNSSKESQKMPLRKMLGILFGCIAGIVLIVCMVFKIYTDVQNSNSYEYQMQMAEQAKVSGNQAQALKYYNTALTLMPEDVSARMEMAEIYMEQEDYDTAMVLYLETVQLDRSQKEAYEKLIELYERNSDYDSILELASYAPNEEIEALFAPYHTDAPVISPISDTYGRYITVNLDSLAGDMIYYTLDESTPDAADGMLYDPEIGIPLTAEGEYTVRAVCVNDKGICSDVSENHYVIKLVSPRDPIVTPGGGIVNTETVISIFAQTGCSVYYTWDGTDPTAQSARYQEPLVIPEGENTLSVIVIDDNTGLASNIFRAVYNCSPATEEMEPVEGPVEEEM